MAIYNSTIIQNIDNNKKTLYESLCFIFLCSILCCLYWHFCILKNKDSEKRFESSVKRAKARIELRNELSNRV